MSSANQLFLLADHIKLSLLERQRAQSLKLDGDTKDGHISRSLDQFREGLESLEKEQKRLEEAEDEDGALTIADNLPGLQQQYKDLQAQFHGFGSPADSATTTKPNDPALAGDFEHATSMKPDSSPSPSSKTRPKGQQRTASKTVRFSDNPEGAAAAGAGAGADEDVEAQRRLFGARYTDNPGDESLGYRDEAESGQLDNQQLHAYHERILSQQDEQLDALGHSIARQRELSMQIGDELDDQVAMLDEVDGHVDRHQSRLDRARRSLGRFARSAGESKQMIAIVVLIIVLVLLIVILK